MKFTRQLWEKDNFSKAKFPNWNCPFCAQGILSTEKESINTFYTQETRKAQNNLFYEAKANAEFRFFGYLRCNECDDRVTIAGTGKYFMEALTGPASAGYKGKKYMVYFPTNFVPELRIIDFPISINGDIASLLIKSFGHFWYDLDACANKIRQAIELVVNQLGGSGRELHQRIESLRIKLGDRTTNRLCALKWIGNEGSHVGRPFQKSEILDAYDLLEDVLAQLYPDHSDEERKDKIVEKIISNKGLKKA